MKKQMKRLQLSRETLHYLYPARLTQARGADNNDPYTITEGPTDSCWCSNLSCEPGVVC